MSTPKKYHYWIHSSKFTALAKFSNLFINVLSFIVLARVLTPSEFGVWSLFTMVFAIIQTARISLIRSAFIRFVQQTDAAQHGRLQAAAFVMSLALSLVLCLTFIVFAAPAANTFNAPGLDVMLRWGALSLIVNTVTSHCEMSLVARMNFKAVSFMYIARQAFFLLMVVVYWLLGLHLSAAALSFWFLLSIIVSNMVVLKSSRELLQLSFHNYKAWAGKLWQYGKYVFGTNIAAQGFRATDAFLSASIFTPAISALYSASNRISNLIDIPSQVLSDVAFTKAAAITSEDKGSAKNMYEKTTGAIMVFSLPALIAILIFPEIILKILAGDAFIAAAPILRITAFFGFVLPFLKQYGTIMDATGLPHINFRTNVLALVLNITFNYIGLKAFGYMGAAIGTAAMYACIFGVTQYILYRRFGVQVWNVFRNMFHFYGEIFKMIQKKGLAFTK